MIGVYFDMHSFCDGCGDHRLRMPFGQEGRFFDVNHGPCPSCGEPGPGHQHICRLIRPVGSRWWHRRVWLDRSGNRVDVPKETRS